MKSSIVRDLTREVAASGLKLLDIGTHANGHYKVRVMRDDGAAMTVTTSATASDWRTVKNRAALLKRFALNREITHEH